MASNDFVFWLTAVITISYQLLFFFIASWNRFDKVTDFAGGSNFAINALVSLIVGGTFSTKHVVATVCVCIWAFRLAAFLLIRVMKAGEDKRFDEMRDHFLQFLFFWIFQMVWVYGVGLPVVYLNASPDDFQPFGQRAGDIAGLILWILGFLWETIADQQKFNHRFYTVPRWRIEHPDQPPPLLSTGLWQWSRQPNYFGEILLWWGMFIMCLPSTISADGQPYVTLISPLLTTLLLLFLSGIPLAEKSYQKRYLESSQENQQSRTAFLTYRLQTSPLIPFPPRLYASLPLWFKRVFLFEFKMYETDYWTDALKNNTKQEAVVGEEKEEGEEQETLKKQ